MNLRRLLALAASSALVGAGSFGLSPAEADAGDIGPGSQLVTAGAQCTANFVFASGNARYVGYAAHCAANGPSTNSNGCDPVNQPLPPGTEVQIEDASRPGTLAYSSWAAMQAAGETDPETCQYNDFALVRVDPADHDLINPEVPITGGPTAIGRDRLSTGQVVTGYGNSGLRLGIGVLKPKVGSVVTSTAGGWGHLVYLVTPAIPGDSGSGLMANGRAVGVASTLVISPLPGSNYYIDVGRAVDYAAAQGVPLSLFRD